MKNLRIPYLVSCVALIAICLAYWQYPQSEPNPASGVNYSWLIDFRPLGLVGAISIFMHVACDMLGLRSVFRWMVGTIVPSLAMLGWWLWWVSGIKASGVHHPITIRPTEVFVIHLITFTAGFAVVSIVLSWIRSWLGPEHQGDAFENANNH